MLVAISGQAGAGKDTVADFLVKDHQFAKVSLADPLKRICKDIFDFSDQQLWGPSEMRNQPDKRYPREQHEFTFDTEGKSACKVCGFKTQIFKDGNVIVSEAPPMSAWPQCYLTPRYALQLSGTEFGRKCYPNVWIDYALRVSEQLLNEGYSYSQQQGAQARRSHARDGGARARHTLPYAGVVIPDCRFINEMKVIRAANGKVIRIKRQSTSLQEAAAQHASEKEQQSIPDKEFDHVILNDTTIEDLGNKITQFLAQ
jgi:hypothetical protein